MSVEEKKELQRKYCKENGYPHFAPRNGKCWHCGRQIYNRISIARAANTLITSCDWCNKSFCE